MRDEREINERLARIEGYLDSVPTDDARWLVTVVKGLMTELRTTTTERNTAETLLDACQHRLSQIAGDVDTCPCRHPDDHAGWCPRR